MVGETQLRPLRSCLGRCPPMTKTRAAFAPKGCLREFAVAVCTFRHWRPKQRRIRTAAATYYLL